MQDSPAVAVALAHVDAWSHDDWQKTRELLAPDVQATVTSTQPGYRDADLTGIDIYMERKTKAARLIEPGSVRVLSAIGDERSALARRHVRDRAWSRRGDGDYGPILPLRDR
jgi:hypothetical protein